jgi:hypothetical protein
MSPLAYPAQPIALSLFATKGTCALAGLGIRANGPSPASEYFTSKTQGFQASGALVRTVGLKPEDVT